MKRTDSSFQYNCGTKPHGLKGKPLYDSNFGAGDKSMADLVELNWFLLVLVFSVSVLVRILQYLNTSFCDKVRGEAHH